MQKRFIKYSNFPAAFVAKAESFLSNAHSDNEFAHRNIDVRYQLGKLPVLRKIARRVKILAADKLNIYPN